METIIRQAAGIDCGSQELVVSFGLLFNTGSYICRGTKAFTNSLQGFKQLRYWVNGLAAADTPLLYVMEATGVYHERLAYHLVGEQNKVSIVLPNKVSAFAKTCTSKKLDDTQASRVLAEFGCVKQLDHWQPPHRIFAALKQLSREKHQLQQELTVVNNQLHAEGVKAVSADSSIKRMRDRVKLIEKQLEAVEQEMEELANEDATIKNKMEKVCTIPGVGMQTLLSVLAETNGFNLVRNSRQLVSYAGLDVVQKLSGTSVRGRAHISKQGNAHLRHCLYFPAFSAARHNKELQPLYERIVAKDNIKMKGYVAVQRKLLVLIYTLWKKDEEYHAPVKHSEQPHTEAALTELDLVRS
jgi:transposase